MKRVTLREFNIIKEYLTRHHVLMPLGDNPQPGPPNYLKTITKDDKKVEI